MAPPAPGGGVLLYIYIIVPSFPLGSVRSWSFLVASRAFRLGSSPNEASEAPQLRKTVPIREEFPQRNAPRQVCGASCATSKSF